MILQVPRKIYPAPIHIISTEKLLEKKSFHQQGLMQMPEIYLVWTEARKYISPEKLHYETLRLGTTSLKERRLVIALDASHTSSSHGST